MSCKSAIYTANENVVNGVSGNSISIGGIVRRFGKSIGLSGDNIELLECGYYYVNANVTVSPESVGDVKIALYKDGVSVQGAEATCNVSTVGNQCSVNIPCIVKHGCGVGNLKLMLDGVQCDIVNVGVVVMKI